MQKQIKIIAEGSLKSLPANKRYLISYKDSSNKIEDLQTVKF